MSTIIPTTVEIATTASQLRSFFLLASAFANDSVLLTLFILEVLEILGILQLSKGGPDWRNENDWRYGEW
jgi:hypothetical protein